MPRAGLDRDAVVDLAVAVVDDAPAGLDGLTLAAVAGRAGVAVPSLYKHVGSLADLRASVALVAVRRLTTAASAAAVGLAGAEAVGALADAVRRFAHEHPGLYSAVQLAASDDPELAAGQADLVAVFAAALRGFRLPDERMVDAVRAIRSGVHGFVDLEARGGFGLPQDRDASFDALIRMLVAGISELARR